MKVMGFWLSVADDMVDTDPGFADAFLYYAKEVMTRYSVSDYVIGIEETC